MGCLTRTAISRALVRVALGVALLATPLVVTGCFSNPKPVGAWHVLRPGETIWSVARNYGTSVKRIVRSNRIGDVREVQAGRRIWVPGGKPPHGMGSGTPGVIQGLSRQTGPEGAASAKQAARRAKLTFRWPTEGRMTSRFGRRWGRKHQGIDLAARPGTPVRAAEAGRVIHSGKLGAYGKVVVVRHSKEFTTVYAHNRKIHVNRHDWVERGDRIAEVGSTGRSTGPHLHFEVRRGRTPQDPLLYLP